MFALALFGEIKFVTATDPDQVVRSVDALIDEKRKSYALLGVQNMFEWPGYRDFFIDLANGAQSLVPILTKSRTRYLIISFTSDWLYPPYQTEEMVTALENSGKPVEYHLITSSYGHDAFLINLELVAPPLKRFLERNPAR